MGTRYGRKQLRAISGAAVATAIVAIVGAAVASTYGRTVVALPFTTRQPSTSTGLRISIHYRDEHDPNAKPKTFHKLEVELPAGIRIDQRVVPACTASDSELMAQGPSACPRSKVGDGTVTLMTGFSGLGIAVHRAFYRAVVAEDVAALHLLDPAFASLVDVGLKTGLDVRTM